jgi:hypothetical protein
MTARLGPRVVGSTIGEGNPAHLTGRKEYRYKGRPGWPHDPATRDDQGVIQKPQGGALVRKANRQERLKLFTAAREEKPPLSVEAAGKRAGVARKTAYRYESDRLAALAGDAS